MVNVNNYGVNNPNVGPAGPYTNNFQTQNNPAVNNNTFNKNDSYAFNLSNVPTGNIPDVKVGMWDKVTAYFNDVGNSPENLKQYKIFKTAMESNPDGYLQPGSSDVGKVRDLQKKLSFIGVKLVVNGEFGHATEQAVINFKKSVGINDGFLTEKGDYAVTPVVTPQTWNMINAQVASKLNPNANITGGTYVPPVTSEELKWAKELQAKSAQFGYKPSPAERQKYESIYQRQQMNISLQNGSFNPNTVSAPTQQEIDWAKELINKKQKFGYKQTPQETQKYLDIYQRQRTAREQQQSQPVQTTQLTNQPGGVTQSEMTWAVNLMNKMKSGYKATPDEEIKYQDIFSRSQITSGQQAGATRAEMEWAYQLETRVNSQGYNPTAQEKAKYEDIFKRSQSGGTVSTTSAQNPNTVPVSQSELSWAQQLESRVNTQGYKPTSEEKAKYEFIYNRLNSVGLEGQGNTTSGTVQKPTDQEVSWAMELERKTKEENYQPNQNELAIYNDIATRLENYTKTQQQNNGATPDELSWASTMYGKMQNGYQPTQQEMSILSSIQSKIQGGQQNNIPDNSTQPFSSSNNNYVANEPQNDFTSVGEFAYNEQTINAFKSAFPGVSFLGNNIPYLPASAGKQAAQKFGFGSVSELQSAVGANVDGKFGPETYFRLMGAKSTGGQTVNKPSQTGGGVTQQELDWAVNLQNKFSGGYKPTQEEMSQYTDIYNRYQASGNQVTDTQNSGNVTSSGAPTQEELDWAVALQSKLGSGYQPTAQEKARYEDIYNRYQVSGNQVASNPAVQNNNMTQNTYNYQPTIDTNTPTSNIDENNTDPELQWALQLLDRVQQQGYIPTDAEIQKYEQVIAKNQSVVANP